ncbi:hypothetical protein P7K49_009361, partial [Saguinus oedipus]
DRSPSKKHAGTRPLKERPHGKTRVEGAGARTKCPFLFFASSFSRVPAAQSLFSRWEQRLRVRQGGGVEGRWGLEVARQDPLGQRHRRKVGSALFSLQVQELPSQVLTHNNSEQGEECGVGKGRKARKEKLVQSSSLGTSARGTRGPEWSRLRDSWGEGRALRASSAAAHGSEQPSWATPGPGKGTAAISVPGELPPRITLPYSSAPPFALASRKHRGSGAPSSSGSFSGESSRVPGRRGGWLCSPLALPALGAKCPLWLAWGPITPRPARPRPPISGRRCSASRRSGSASESPAP